MAIFNEETIRTFSDLEKIRNMQLKKYNSELEKICKMPEEERIEQMEKMRVLLRLKELYENLDIKIVEEKMIFFKGNIVVSEKQLKEIDELAEKCFEEERNYNELVKSEEFILTNDIRIQIEEYMEIRDFMLGDYIIHSIKGTMPQLYPQSTYLMSCSEYVTLIKKLSELKISIENGKVYVTEKQITKKADYFNIVKQINQINEIAKTLLENIL